jgi:hypothetical protein
LKRLARGATHFVIRLVIAKYAVQMRSSGFVFMTGLTLVVHEVVTEELLNCVIDLVDVLLEDDRLESPIRVLQPICINEGNPSRSST